MFFLGIKMKNSPQSLTENGGEFHIVNLMNSRGLEASWWSSPDEPVVWVELFTKPNQGDVWKYFPKSTHNFKRDWLAIPLGNDHISHQAGSSEKSSTRDSYLWEGISVSSLEIESLSRMVGWKRILFTSLGIASTAVEKCRVNRSGAILCLEITWRSAVEKHSNRHCFWNRYS